MIPPALQEYLEQCKAKSLTFDHILPEIRRSGWTPQVIAAARQWYSPGSVPTVVRDRSSKFKFLVPLLLVLALLILTSGVVLAYFVATDKIALSNTQLRNTITNVVFSVPFVPKTTKFILAQSILSHQKLSQNSLDVSFALKSDNFQQLTGGNEIDAQVKGYTDFSDVKNPRASLNVSITKDFNFDFRKDNKTAYFKVNKVPLLLLAPLGIDPEKINPLLTNWISWDTSPLDTQASKELEKLSDSTKSQTDKAVSSVLTTLFNEDILPAITTTSDKLDKIDVYKLELKPDAALLDKIGFAIQKEAAKDATTPKIYQANPKEPEKLSTYMKNVDITLMIDTKTHHVLRASLVFTLDTSATTTQRDTMTLPGLSNKSPVNVAIVASLSDFGKTLPVETPKSSLTPEQFYSQLLESIKDSPIIGGTRQP